MRKISYIFILMFVLMLVSSQMAWAEDTDFTGRWKNKLIVLVIGAILGLIYAFYVFVIWIWKKFI